MAERFSSRCERVLELGGGSGSVSTVIQRRLKDKRRHVVVQPDERMEMMGGLKRLVKNREADQLQFQIIGHMLRPGEGHAVIAMLAGRPDCIVADCEDCLWDEYKKNQALFADVKQIQVERDDPNRHYEALFQTMGMKKIHTGRGCGVHLPNQYHKREGMLCTTEVWERVAER